VVFPSVDELIRMADVEFTLKNHGVTLTISEWKDASDVEPSYQLDEVWVHVRGVPHAWRHYLGFWALGSVIGATLDVDMYTYRKMGVIRLLVGVMSRDPLPLTTDIVFDKKGYEITYSIEDKNFIPASPVIFREESHNDGGGGMDKVSEQEDKSPEHAFKKHKLDGKGGGAGSMAGGFGDGEDSPMLGAAAISPLEKANEPVPAVMKGFPLLNLSALHSVRPSLIGRTGADLKLHKNGMSSAAGFLSGGKRSSVVGSYDTNGCNLMLQSILDEQIVSNMKGADPTGVINSVHTTRIVPDASSWSKVHAFLPPSLEFGPTMRTEFYQQAARQEHRMQNIYSQLSAGVFSCGKRNIVVGSDSTNGCNFLLQNIPDEQLVSNKKGVGPSVVLTSAHTAMNMPAACCWSMVHVCPPPILEIYPPPMQTEYSLQPAFQGQRSFAFEREGQPMDDVRKIERSLHIGAGQVKLPIPPEKKLMPPGKGSNFFPLYKNNSDSPAFVRRSARFIALSKDGSTHVDEDSTLKAMKRASRRNLDGDLSGFKPAGQALRTVSTSSLPIGPFQSGMEQASAVTAINDLSNLSCASKLKKIGFMLGDDEFAVNRSINGLKKMELDRKATNSHTTLESPSLEESNTGNSCSVSDEEVDEINNDLLTHLLKDVADANFDDVDLDTKICDLMASARQSKKRPKNHKSQYGGGMSKQKMNVS
jgi:hypothetical protein